MNKQYLLDLTFFSLDGKEPKDQERLIAQPRTRSAHHAWAQTWRLGMSALSS